MNRALVILLALTLTATAAFAKGKDLTNDTLNLGYSSLGPLQIQVTGPQALVDLAKGKDTMPAGGCGYTLNWGDNTAATPSTTAAPYCAVDLKHTYAKGGRYEIEAYIDAPNDPNARNGKLHGLLAVILN